MTDDLSLLSPDVRIALARLPDVIADAATVDPSNSEGDEDALDTIRAELLRVTAELAHEEQRVLSAMDALHEGDKELTRVKAKLAKLRARLADAPVVEVASFGDPFIVLPVCLYPPKEMKGKHVRLLIEDEND